MKKILLTLILVSSCLSLSLAQGNPSVSSAGFSTSPIKQKETTTLTVVVTNATFSSGDVPSGNFRVQISLPSNEVYTLSNGATPAGNGNTTTPTTLQISDNFGNAFNWLGDGTGYYQGTSNKVIPQGTQITILFKIYGNTTSGSTATTVNVQGLAGTAATNNSGDDNRSAELTVDAPLPVTLTSFTATKEGQTAQLKWSTTEETNSDRFEIERSQNGKNWDLIGTQKSNGESTSLKNYTFSDGKPLNGENLYRLKMIDKDETYAYSRIQSLTFESNLTTSFYPNPVAEKLIIKTEDFSLVKNVKIFDANGKTVYQSSASPTSEINVQNLSAGLYIVQMVSRSGAVISHKVIKQ